MCMTACRAVLAGWVLGVATSFVPATSAHDGVLRQGCRFGGCSAAGDRFPIGWCIRARPEVFNDAKRAGFEYVELALQDVLDLSDADFEALRAQLETPRIYLDSINCQRGPNGRQPGGREICWMGDRGAALAIRTFTVPRGVHTEKSRTRSAITAGHLIRPVSWTSQPRLSNRRLIWPPARRSSGRTVPRNRPRSREPPSLRASPSLRFRGSGLPTAEGGRVPRRRRGELEPSARL